MREGGREVRWQVSRHCGGGGRRSGSRAPAPLSARSVPYPDGTPRPPPPLSLEVPGLSPGQGPPVTSRPWPGHLARSKPGAWCTEALRRPPLLDPAKCLAAAAAEAGLPSVLLSPPSPFRPEVPGRLGRKGLEWSRRRGSPSHGLAPRRWRCPTPAGGTRRPPLGGLVLQPRDGTEAAASSQAGPGGGAWRAGPRDSSPLRGQSRPLAGPANHHGPMTSRPDPSRPGPRETTEDETLAALLLSPPPPLQPQLPGSTETPAHLSFPQRAALGDGT